MIRLRHIRRDERGTAIIELAFALPILLIMIWMIIQMGMVFRAMAGIQHSLGEGARAATLWPTPDAEAIKDKMEQAVFGIGPGDFDIPEPVEATADGSTYYDLEVTYTQDTNLLVLPGPTVSVSRTKRVWVAED